ncbi:MAG: hypothetical protein BLM47_10155 [Candidatus Reconcilbacillus cellulovorans]|uniref:M23ase beta-sheet core domain-containing protein n=1 Tax=Candidatus Reconcilbacillus cellulovorans TaxID=1906605 RepID=A0A2A6DXQ8_9BACL|nr:MAG: hypothetical protein BLM47_10155 [Candidatus Reconcilbacillus cellulovorans]
MRRRRIKDTRLTFVLIPDSTGPVRRLDVSRRTFRTAGVLTLAAIVGAGGWMAFERWAHVRASAALRGEMEKQKQQYENLISDKQAEIRRLEEQMEALSRQLDDVRGRLEELRRLEEEVRALSGVRPDRTAVNGGEGFGLPIFRLRASGADFTALFEQLVRLSAETERLEQDLERAALSLREQQRKKRAVPSIWPVRSRLITSGFGLRRDPFTGENRFHTGIDIAASAGEPVFAAADGTVTRAERDASEGNVIEIAHEGDVRTVYMHLSRMFVKKGQTVRQGATIGAAGSTGRSTGPHLHFEIVVGGRPVNPKLYLSAAVPAETS